MATVALRDVSPEEADRICERVAAQHGEDVDFLKRVMRAIRHLDAANRITLEALQSVRQPL